MKLSNKLIELRKEKGWSQEDFAEKLDVSRQAISRWENGMALPDAQNILRISKLFDVTSDYLLNDDYENEERIPSVEAQTEETPRYETEQLSRKRKFSYWYLIPVICLIILAFFVIMKTVDSTDEINPHPQLNSVKENEIASTCNAEGSYDEVVYCDECGEEILRTAQSTARLAHTLSNSVKENVVAPTCAAKGSYDEVVYCTVCGEEMLRTRRSTEMLSHQFQNRKCILCGQSQPSEGLLYMSNSNGTCTVGIGECTDENIVVPEYSPSGERVVQIKAWAFAFNSKIKSVEIPETVTVIGEGAFQDCINLESANLPSGITRIYSYTFDGCKNLKEITIPAGVYYIGEEAFADCVACESIVIPASVTKIGKFAFRNFSGCDGTVLFEIYVGWSVYDSSGALVHSIDFNSSSTKPVIEITFKYSEYLWKRN